MMPISELYGCFFTSTALIVFAVLLAILAVLIIIIFIISRNEQKIAKKHKEDNEKLINK